MTDDRALLDVRRRPCAEDDEWRARWTELFVDLVFVLVVAQLSAYLHEHLSLRGGTARSCACSRGHCGSARCGSRVATAALGASLPARAIWTLMLATLVGVAIAEARRTRRNNPLYAVVRRHEASG